MSPTICPTSDPGFVPSRVAWNVLEPRVSDTSRLSFENSREQECGHVESIVSADDAATDCSYGKKEYQDHTAESRKV